MRGPIEIARIILILIILSTLKRLFAPLNMHEKFAHMSGLVKNFVFCSRYARSPAGGATINKKQFCLITAKPYITYSKALHPHVQGIAMNHLT